MARNKMEIDFAGITDYENTLAGLGDEALQKAVVNALDASKKYVNAEIKKAMDASPYNFNGRGYSKRKAKHSLTRVNKINVKIKKKEAIAFSGVSYYEAPELWYIANGAPNTPKDNNIYNAVRVKGPIKKEVERIQKEEFTKVIEEALQNG